MTELIMVKDISLSDYLETLASALPAPGAGCAAAITGAQGAALLAMVCNLTLGKKRYTNVQEEINQLRLLFEGRRRLMVNLAEADMLAFEGLVHDYKSPLKKEQKEDKIQNGLKKSVEIPMQLLTICADLLQPASRLSEICYTKVQSDVLAAVILLKASINCSKTNIEHNLKEIDDKGFCEEKRAQLGELLEQLKNGRIV